MRVFIIIVIITALIGSSLTASFKELDEKEDNYDNESVGKKYLPDDPKIVKVLSDVNSTSLPAIKTY